MRLTRAATYALQAVLYIASEETSKVPIASHVIAKAEGMPERFLLKALKPLTSAQILVSVKGPNGGYQLARSPSAVSLLEIIEAVDGSVRGHSPISESDPSRPLSRRLEEICTECAETVRRRLHKIKIVDLIRP
jgi:Rrf2 family protein